ncbi:hypothetical protein [Achromobacter sp.]|uniref:hypothetical protein n=1 Tax=Achromobacter sp. TaxID=134375 RepID=UPI002F95A9A5
MDVGDSLLTLAAAFGNWDWQWWDSCYFRDLTFEDDPNRRDGSAPQGVVQRNDGHPDIEMAPGVREFIEAPRHSSILSRDAHRTQQRSSGAGPLGRKRTDNHLALRVYVKHGRHKDTCYTIIEIPWL